MLKTAFVHHFRGFHHTPSRCIVRVYEHERQIVVVCSEQTDNPGTSITNVADALATQLWNMLGLPPLATFFYIEHYPNRGRCHEQPDGTVSWDHPEEFAEVTFTLRGEMLTQPRWLYTERRDVESLIGQRWNEMVPDDNRYQRVLTA